MAMMMPGDGVSGHENKVYQVAGEESNFGVVLGFVSLHVRHGRCKGCRGEGLSGAGSENSSNVHSL